MRRTAIPEPAAVRTRSKMRSSIPQASNGTSVYSLPKTVSPIFFKPIFPPAAAITPRSQVPFSADAAGLALVLAFGADFLAAGLADVVAGVAAAPGAGWICPDADAARHDNTHAIAKTRTMRTR